MNLRKCPGCKKPVYADMVACPHCGRRFFELEGAALVVACFLAWLLIVIVLVWEPVRLPYIYVVQHVLQSLASWVPG